MDYAENSADYADMGNEDFDEVMGVNSRATPKPDAPSQKPEATHAEQKEKEASRVEQAQTGNTKKDDKFASLQRLMIPFDSSIPVEKTEFIGGLFPRGYVSVIVAPSGTGKSLAIQKMFTDLSWGGEFLKGHDGDDTRCFADNEPARKCVILCGELGEQGLRERAVEFGLHPNPKNVIVLDQTACEAANVSFMLDSKQGIENVEFIARTKPDVLFIDSFTAFFGGKENDNSECNAVFGALRRIASKYKIAIVVTHHSRKRLSSEQSKPLTLDDVVGSGAITRHVHTVIAIEFIKNFKMNKVTCLKCWSKKFKPFGYSVKNGLYGSPNIDIDLAPDEIDEEKLNTNASNTNPTPEWQTLLRGFLIGKGKEGATLTEILKAVGAKDTERNTYKVRINRMKDKGEIIRVKHGLYALPEDKLIPLDSEQLEIPDDNEEG